MEKKGNIFEEKGHFFKVAILGNPDCGGHLKKAKFWKKKGSIFLEEGQHFWRKKAIFGEKGQFFKKGGNILE